jgi:EmrB/QacA subfamily drug resistance transporter
MSSAIALPVRSPARWSALGVLSLSVLVISLDNTILNTALPSLQRDLGASAAQLQWVVDAYMLVFAGLLLTAGSLGDRFGRRRALEAGMVLFGTGSALSALAGSPDVLIATRALMGVGGALIMPSTLSLLTTVFDRDERPKAIGAWAATAGLGIALGPVLGGWLLEHFDWSAVFIVNLPVVATALLLGRRYVPESRDPAAPRLDLPGFALSIAGLTAIVWAIIEAPARGWTSPAIVGTGGGGLVMLLAFGAWELRARAPMLDLALFRNPRFSASSGAITLAYFAMFGTIFFLSQYLQGVLGGDPLTAGAWVTPTAIGMIAGAGASAKLTERFGTKLVVASGLGKIALGLLLVTQVGTGSGFAAVATFQLMLGLGAGLAMAPATDAVMAALPEAKASVGSAVNDTTRTTGGALGVAVLGSVVSSIYRGDMPGFDSLGAALATGDQRIATAARQAFVHGMHGAALVAAAVALAGGLFALVALPARDA